jgi:hypothetical protein
MMTLFLVVDFSDATAAVISTVDWERRIRCKICISNAMLKREC